MTTDERFWAKVDKSGDCWEWRGHRGVGEYGRLSRRRLSSSPILAHRYSWFLVTGVLPSSDVYVCHRCDNPPCVNPAHLFIGTAKDNNDDKLAKGRGTKPPRIAGLGHPCAWISDPTIRSARLAYAGGAVSQLQIAIHLGVSPSTVREWMSGASRLEAGGPITSPRPRRKRKVAA